MPATSVAGCILAALAVSATARPNSGRLWGGTATREAQHTENEKQPSVTARLTALAPAPAAPEKAQHIEIEKLPSVAARLTALAPVRAAPKNATAKLNPTAIRYIATAKLPVSTVHVSDPPRWQTKQQKRDAKHLRNTPRVPGKIAGAMAGALGAAAVQANANREREEAKRRAMQSKREMEAKKRELCEGAEAGSARARRCAQGSYPSAPSGEDAGAEATVPAAPNPTSRSSTTVPLGHAKADKRGLLDEKEIGARALRKFGNADGAVKAADSDGDGNVSKEELEQFLKDELGFTPEQAGKLARQLMKKYDIDGDGKLTDEQVTDILRTFGKFGGASGVSALPALALALVAYVSLA